MSGKWEPATSKSPCQNCGKTKRCSRSADGNATICYSKEIPGGKQSADKNGDSFWKKVRFHKQGNSPAKATASCATDSDCGRVYEYLLSILTLDGEHKALLEKRGLSEQQIVERNYRSLPAKGRYKVYRELESKFGQDLLKSIPGIILKDGRWGLGGASGLLIPVRDQSGQAVRLIVRPEKIVGGNKYLWLSSGPHGGPGSGTAVHIPLHVSGAEVVRVTEGQLKADIATALSGVHTIGVAGVGNWKPALEVLKDLGAKTARVAFDADAAKNPKVAGHLLQLFNALIHAGFIGEYERWDESAAKGVDDALFAGLATEILVGDEARAAIESLPSLNQQSPIKNTTADQSFRPEISFGLIQMHELIAKTWEVVVEKNKADLKLFARDHRLVRLVNDETKLQIKEFDTVEIFGHLVRVADWFEEVERDVKGYTQTFSNVATPPKDLAKDLLAYIDDRIPKLHGVIDTPIFGKDGTLIENPGYNAQNELFMDPKRMVNIPPVAAVPSAEEVKAAVDLILNEVLCDFPFANEKSDKCHILAALITACLREQIDGPTPLFLANATSPGSGKGLLMEVMSIILTGRTLEARTLPGNDDEVRKMLTAELLRGPRLILLDNADQEAPKLHSPALAAALTSVVWTDRFLSRSQMVSSLNKALWLMTGNNVRLTTEIARRAIQIGLQPKESKPWERKADEFRHPNLREWVIQNRPRLLNAILTICQAWLASGTSYGAKSLGSFESWSGVVGGVLEHAGVEGFLETKGTAYELADAETEEWRDFVDAWRERHGLNAAKVSSLYCLCEELELLAAVLGPGSDRSRQTKLGIGLSNQLGRIYGPVAVTLSRDKGKHGKWYKLAPSNLATSTVGPCQGSPSEFQGKSDSKGTFDNLGDLFSTVESKSENQKLGTNLATRNESRD